MAFEDVPLGSGGSAVPKLTRSFSRQCLACEHKAKVLPEIPEPASAPPVLPEPIFTTSERVPQKRVAMPQAKPDNVQEALEDRDPNNLNQHVQVKYLIFNFKICRRKKTSSHLNTM